MKRYIYHITLMILTIFGVNDVWGDEVKSSTWNPCANDKTISGTYVLKCNTTLTGAIYITDKETLTIDLNGYTLTRQTTGNGPHFVFVVSSGRTLNIEDNSTAKTGRITNGKGDRGGCALISGTVNLKGGTIDNCVATVGTLDNLLEDNDKTNDLHQYTQGCGGAFFVNSGATLNMTGGVIKSCSTSNKNGTNSSYGRGGAIYVAGNFNMSGGTIKECEANLGGAIYVHGYLDETEKEKDSRLGSVTLSGNAIITKNRSFDNGCGIYTKGQVNISENVEISSNRPTRWPENIEYYAKRPKVRPDGGHGGGIFAHGIDADIIMSGGSIKDNYGESGGGVMLWYDSYMEMTGGTMSGNYAIGVPTVGNGGAVYVQGATFKITGGTLSRNTANRYGGAINTNQDATLEIGGNCIIENNNASHGGGISQEAGECSLTLSSSDIIIRGNEAHGEQVNYTNNEWSKNDDEGNGGGLFIEKGTLTIKGAQILNNTAEGHGGGASIYAKRIHAGTTTAIITDGALIQGNSAAYGGGIDLYSDHEIVDGQKNNLDVQLIDATVKDNTASLNGAGIYVSFNEQNSTAKMTIGDATHTPLIQNNTSLGDGGGLGMSNNGVFDVKNANMSNNTAKNGGAIWLGSGTFTIDNGTFTSNTAVENGGGIYVGGGIFTVNKTVSMNGNVAKNQAGGGIYLGSGQFTVESNGTINLGVDGSGNSAGTNGGGIYCNAPLTVKGNTYIQNGSAQQGGGLYVQGTAKFAKITKFVNNHSALDGGAVYVNNGNIVIQGTNLILANNHSLKNGGAFFVNGGGIDASTCSEATITNNYSGNEGGAFYVNNGDIQLCTTNLSNNGKNGSTPSTKNGGAIALHNGIFAFGNGSVIENNAAIEHGGALYVSNESETPITCEGGEYIANEAKLGGGIYASGPITLTFAATINSNKAWNGGGLYLDGGVTMNFGNGLIKANTANPNTQTADDGTQYGVGGGIYLAQGTLNFTEQNSLGIYNNNASYEAADIYASGNSTTINLPNVSNMNLTGFDTPGNILYWVYDFNDKSGNNNRYGRYEAALRSFSNDGIEKMILPFEKTENTKEIIEEICLDLGYDLVYVTIETTGLDQSDIAALLISYKKENQEAKLYRKVVFMGERTLLIGLPTGNFWKFDASEWAVHYNAPEIKGSIGTNNLYIIDKYNKSIKVNFTKKDKENNVDMTKTKIYEYMKVNKMNPTKQTTGGTNL